MDKQFDIKNLAKHFLPAVLIALLSMFGYLESSNNIANNKESVDTEVAKLGFELDQMKLRSAELIGEQRAQRELITDLRMDIREIKTILEQVIKERRK